MTLCRFSAEYLMDTFTPVDNIFISTYLPSATEVQIKVYLYGLFHCNLINAKDNDVSNFAKTLNFSQEEIISAFEFWEEQGLIKVINQSPLQIKFLPIRLSNPPSKKYNPAKYADFNANLQEFFPTRMLTPNELLKYYEIIEENNFEQEALLMIVKYCIALKGYEVKYPYILTVAKDWARLGAITMEAVEEKLKEYDSLTDDMRTVFKELGKASSPDFNDKQMLLKWRNSWGFDYNTIIFVASLCKKRGGMDKLDSMLDNFYKLNLFTIDEIMDRKKYLDLTYDLARNINKVLGVYYETVDFIVEQYITPWLNKGFTKDSLLLIAKYASKKGYRNHEALGSAINKFYKQGLITEDSIVNYIDELVVKDNFIRSLIVTTGSTRQLLNQDRDFYNTWSNLWNFTDDIIEFCSKLCEGKPHAFSAMNQILSRWHNSNIKTIEKAKENVPDFNYSHKKSTTVSKDYTKEELSALFHDTASIEDMDF